jgi:translation initiation factor IF-2
MTHKTSQQKTIERPPIIVVMGHVDHGKSTLLDSIRKENTTDAEAGGITQHIAAYEVVHPNQDGIKKKITFIDTPGHAAFEAIRARGAEVADIAILIIATDDGVNTQTKEALEAIKKSGVQFVVALNKTDLPSANVEKTINQLTEVEVYLEGRGGSVPFVEISAKTGKGIPELLETLLLVAEISELTMDPTLPAEGFVLEANRNEQKGISGTLLIKNGSVSTGMVILAGIALAPVRIMENFAGVPQKTAQASSPITIIGFDMLPKVGVVFKTFKKKKDAEKERNILSNTQPTTEDTSATYQPTTEEHALVPLIIKADVSGTVEAIEQELAKMNIERVIPKIIFSGVGVLSENDMKAFGDDENGIAVGFGVRIDERAKELADRNNFSVKTFSIIYELTEWLKEELQKRAPKITVAEVIGSAKILKTFSRTRDKQVIGGRILDGMLKNGARVRILRRESEIGEGTILELQQQKNKTGNVTKGEFGMHITARTEIASGDILEAIQMVEK